MNNALSQAQKIRSRKIIDADKNALIKEYQKRLVELSFARKNKDDVSEEYDQIVKKIQILRHGVDEIH
ncbi:MAG TPA: hypothetical protein PK055_10315 [Gammaproteobacteria bacterium]|nr:hypothetical protein [Xanthomonadales bacterium]MCB1603799.1 hypothetical protein [Xanthomonadales bacterium]HOP23209.1 hypothetical protein [Gammaproteobacteria bacterium]HPQ88040.1 hypothetical protein [Gammaproteobacteria bacterium]